MHLCIEKGLEMSIVSVIIPVHNTADYLRKCVESVRDQSLKDIEIILVDNLSTDDSPAMCDAYAKLDSRIKVLHLPVADLSTARNAGIKEATSEYIGFIDSDDHISSTIVIFVMNIRICTLTLPILTPGRFICVLNVKF